MKIFLMPIEIIGMFVKPISLMIRLFANITAVHKLNDIEKGIVFLYLENKNYREISETLGISEVNARVRMNRIKTKLKTKLNS